MTIKSQKTLYYLFGVKRLVFYVVNPYLRGTFLPFKEIVIFSI